MVLRTNQTTRGTTMIIPTPAITETHRAATKSRAGGSRISAIVRAWHAIDPRCVVCGYETFTDMPTAGMTSGDKATFGHIVPASVITPGVSGGARGGYTADNGILVCMECNHVIGDTTIVNVTYIPTYLGTFPPAKRRPMARKTDKAARRQELGY